MNSSRAFRAIPACTVGGSSTRARLHLFEHPVVVLPPRLALDVAREHAVHEQVIRVFEVESSQPLGIGDREGSSVGVSIGVLLDEELSRSRIELRIDEIVDLVVRPATVPEFDQAADPGLVAAPAGRERSPARRRTWRMGISGSNFGSDTFSPSHEKIRI
jgi:hypothetical protein